MTESDILFLLDELLHHNLSKKEVVQHLLEPKNITTTGWFSTSTQDITVSPSPKIEADLKANTEEILIHKLHGSYQSLLAAIKDVKIYHGQQRNYEHAAFDRDMEKTIQDLKIDIKYKLPTVEATSPLEDIKTKILWENFLNNNEGERIIEGEKYHNIFGQEWITPTGDIDISLHLTQKSRNKYSQLLLLHPEYSKYFRPGPAQKIWVKEKIFQSLLKTTQSIITQSSDIEDEETLLGKYGLHLDAPEYYTHHQEKNITDVL